MDTSATPEEQEQPQVTGGPIPAPVEVEPEAAGIGNQVIQEWEVGDEAE